MSSHFRKVDGNTDVITTRPDPDAARKTPSVLPQVRPASDARLSGLLSRLNNTAPPGIRALSNALQHPIASARDRGELKRTEQRDELEYRAGRISSLMINDRRPSFEKVVNDISQYRPIRERRLPLAALAQQIGGLVYPFERQSAFDSVFDLIVRQPRDQQDLLLSILATQIRRLPEDSRMSRFERIANQITGPGKALDRLYDQLPYVDEQAARAILARFDTM